MGTRYYIIKPNTLIELTTLLGHTMSLGYISADIIIDRILVYYFTNDFLISNDDFETFYEYVEGRISEAAIIVDFNLEDKHLYYLKFLLSSLLLEFPNILKPYIEKGKYINYSLSTNDSLLIHSSARIRQHMYDNGYYSDEN